MDNDERDVLSMHVTVTEAEWLRFVEQLTAEYWATIWATWAEDAQKLRDLDRARLTGENYAQSKKNFEYFAPGFAAYLRQRKPVDGDTE